MFLRHFCVSFAVFIMAVAAAEPAVLTQEEVFNTVIDKSPFLTVATTTIVWTQSPSITTTQAPLAVTDSS
ncbi:hypothetical protein AGABI1DRAFT_116080 [Agaricus bisporus var. burnettii JB137-S8]|uniref:Uncharacterized protein n=1 Tax=Agaricus bisporus var. burnettii (strain JB137-S8 / ATCC MYA-4627 / FGSC 10392) TaxID=597362 RepID=K5VNG7_AGABU|nr:hypothetical protein AGABI2DRAFT_192247 [Agaricus bisporus var. bisporus H97]XP_007333383.1 uncharacterized protein AGABI1DRAFT_116080 [Agaricus bisporus var. burnettii JB137-S8]EKM76009.1 hypothetical protein AGABI1DRAFT_116080 [Agaricus bisporus var. burnettii JB137-S8]EKV48725.1 hypothetical protein AGABI2DRAFT_192247 [Agaricus bisporus var. bisporus H97]